MIIVRFEPENNLEMELEDVALQNEKKPTLVIEKHETKYGEHLKISSITSKT